MSTTATTKTITSGGATTTTTTTVTATKEAAAAADDWALPKKGIKLYYWPATGLAEAIRLMLADNGIESEDVTFDRSDPPPPHCCCCISVIGSRANARAQFYTQSHAVYMLVARALGLYPADTATAYVVDNIVQVSQHIAPRPEAL